MKQGSSYREVGAFTLTSSASSVLPLNKSRKGLLLFNTGANACTFSVGSLDIPIAAGNYIAFTNYAPLNAITAKSASGTTLVVLEA